MNPCLDLVALDGTDKQIRWAYAVLRDFRKTLTNGVLTPCQEAVLGCTEAALLLDHRQILIQGEADTFCREVGIQWLEFSDFEAYAHFPMTERCRTRIQDRPHVHSFVVKDQRYRFLAIGPVQWLHKGDSGRFAWHTVKDRRIMLKGTLHALDRSGSSVCRGDRRAVKLRPRPSQSTQR